MKRQPQRESAREQVLVELRNEVARRRKSIDRGFCTTYRRELARLWLVALRAVERAE